MDSEKLHCDILIGADLIFFRDMGMYIICVEPGEMEKYLKYEKHTVGLMTLLLFSKGTPGNILCNFSVTCITT